MNKKNLLLISLFFGMLISVNAQETFRLPSNYGQSILQRTGTWELRGFDVREWRANLVIVSVDNYVLHGYFDWYAESSQSSGREYFIGIYDENARSITLKGIYLENAIGALASSTIYEALVSNDGRVFSSGFWFGRYTEPGTWEAIWIK